MTPAGSHRLIFAALASLVAMVAFVPFGCRHVDDDRVPAYPVNIVFNTIGEWNLYGVGGAMDSRCFIRASRQPAGFPYTAMTYTGYGGVLLVCDVLGNPAAFDLSCPVEHKQDIRVFINSEYEAECPKCGSRYDVFSMPGAPIAGTAAEKGYGLRRYNVGPGGGSAYMVINN